MDTVNDLTPESRGSGSRRLSFWCLMIVAGVSASRLLAAGPGNEVIIIYNKNLPESKAVADYYAEKRSVPKSQSFGFSVTTNEEMSRAEFREHLQKTLGQGYRA